MRARHSPTLVAALVTFVLGGAPLGAPPGLALPGTARAETITLPADAAAGPSLNDPIYQVACPAAGDCVGVGAYTDTSGHNQALIDDESGGSWSATNIPDSSLPGAGPGFPAQPYLTSVACAAVGACVAADAYDDASGHEQGLIATQAGSSWTPSQLPLAGVGATMPNPGAELYDVACPALGACVGIGIYDAANTYTQGLIATQSTTGWSTAEVPQAPSWTDQSHPDLVDLGCASVGNCAAVGSYTDASGNQQGLLESDADGTWGATELDLQGLTPAANPQALVSAVSCPAAGSCTAVGTYEDASGSIRAFVLSQVAGVWGAPVLLGLPGDASTVADAAGDPIQNDLYLNGISCAAPGDCTAVGSYDAGAANAVEPFAATESAGSWSAGVAVPPPAGVAPPAGQPEAALDSVSCAAAGNCLAAGTYMAASGDSFALIARQTGGPWTTAAADLTTPYDTRAAGQDWASVACAPGGYCAAGGYVAAAGGGSDLLNAFMLDAPGPPAAVTAALSAGQASVSWSPPLDDGGLPVSAFIVTANDLSDPAAGGQSVAVAAGAGGVTIGGLRAGDSYTFTVTAQSLLGTGLPATTAATGTAVPQAAPPATPPPAAPPLAAPPPAGSTTSTGGPTRAEIYMSLRALLRPHGAAARLPRVRRAGGYTFSYRALEAGLVRLRWYRVTAHGGHAHRRLAGSGSVRARRSAAVGITVHLTALGRRLLAAGGRVRLTAVVSFSVDGLDVSRSGPFSLG